MSVNHKVVAVSGFEFNNEHGLNDSTDEIVLCDGESSGKIIKAINVVNAVGETHPIQLSLVLGTEVPVPFATVLIPESAGFDQKSINLLDTGLIGGLEKDISGNAIMKIPPDWRLIAQTDNGGFGPEDYIAFISFIETISEIT